MPSCSRSRRAIKCREVQQESRSSNHFSTSSDPIYMSIDDQSELGRRLLYIFYVANPNNWWQNFNEKHSGLQQEQENRREPDWSNCNRTEEQTSIERTSGRERKNGPTPSISTLIASIHKNAINYVIRTKWMIPHGKKKKKDISRSEKILQWISLQKKNDRTSTDFILSTNWKKAVILWTNKRNKLLKKKFIGKTEIVLQSSAKTWR